MKKLLFLFAMGLLLSSCAKTYYQVCDVQSDLKKNSDGAFVSGHQGFTVEYDFWSIGGKIRVKLTNNTDEFVYVDMAKSFVIMNGIALDYYQNSTVTNSSSYSISKSSGISAAALGRWGVGPGAVPGSIAYASSETKTVSGSKSIAITEAPVVIIPPRCAKVFSEYSVLSSYLIDCDLYEKPGKDEVTELSFSEENSPVTFTNLMSVRIGDGETQVVENHFFLSHVQNLNKKNFVEKFDFSCESDKLPKMGEKFKFSTPWQFYFPYSPREQNKSKTRVSKL